MSGSNRSTLKMNVTYWSRADGRASGDGAGDRAPNP